MVENVRHIQSSYNVMVSCWRFFTLLANIVCRHYLSFQFYLLLGFFTFHFQHTMLCFFDLTFLGQIFSNFLFICNSITEWFLQTLPSDTLVKKVRHKTCHLTSQSHLQQGPSRINTASGLVSFAYIFALPFYH